MPCPSFQELHELDSPCAVRSCHSHDAFVEIACAELRAVLVGARPHFNSPVSRHSHAAVNIYAAQAIQIVREEFDAPLRSTRKLNTPVLAPLHLTHADLFGRAASAERSGRRTDSQRMYTLLVRTVNSKLALCRATLGALTCACSTGCHRARRPLC